MPRSLMIGVAPGYMAGAVAAAEQDIDRGARRTDHRFRPSQPVQATGSKQLSSADEIRSKVSFARQTHPQIATTAADDFIARGLSTDQASEELYSMISNDPDAEAARVVTSIQHLKGTAPQPQPAPASPMASAAAADTAEGIDSSVVATYHKYAGAGVQQSPTVASEPQTEAEMADSVVAAFYKLTGGKGR